MKITIFGATGSLGTEILQQASEQGHEVTVLVRNAKSLPVQYRDKIAVYQGNALNPADVKQALPEGTEAVLFAMGILKDPQHGVCTRATQIIIDAMREANIKRFVYCSGANAATELDQVTFGSRLLAFIGRKLMPEVALDKITQYDYLLQQKDIDWIGVRPAIMKKGPKTGEYRFGFDKYGLRSVIRFSDCAELMLKLLNDQQWVHRAAVVQY